FIVQALQLLHAGRQPFLQGAQTLPGLEKLVQYELLPAEDSRSLAQAYAFLRDVEHRLQMEENLQTHTIPASRHAQERLARSKGRVTCMSRPAPATWPLSSCQNCSRFVRAASPATTAHRPVPARHRSRRATFGFPTRIASSPASTVS